VQIFGYQHGLFSPSLSLNRHHRGLSCFALLSPAAFLINLDKAPKLISSSKQSLELSQSDLSRFSWLQEKLSSLTQVQKLLSGRRKVVSVDDEDDD
jgi:hypothetical protein